MIENKRDLNLDLIRCAALLGVLIMHYYDNSGFYQITMDGAGDFIMAMLRMLSTTCVPLFLMLSGYLCNKKALSPRYFLGLLRVLELYVLCGIASMVFERVYLGRHYGIKAVVSGLLNFEANGYAWYVLLYVGLFLMIPFLNMAYHGCTSKRQKQALVLTAFALSILPSLLNIYFQIYSNWWLRFYPICYYFTGAHLSEYSGDRQPAKWCAALLAATLLFSAFNQFYFHAQAINYDGIHYDHYQVYILAVLVLGFLNSLDLHDCHTFFEKLIHKIAELSFAAYLCSWISDGIIYRVFVPHFPRPEDRFIWILVLVPLSMVASLLMAQLVHWIYKPIDHRLRGWLSARLPADG